MKKICILFLFLLLLSNVYAINETEQVALAYNWLSSSVKDKWTELGTEDAIFSLLALSYNDMLAGEGQKEILKASKKEECWPAESCKVKDTALALLALDRIKAKTEKIEKWLFSQNATPELVWYMQVHTEENAECSISYDNKQYEFDIVDKKISKKAGKCLSIAEEGYWFKIAKDCLEKTFVVSCDKDFLVSLLYKKNIYYVSSQISKETAGGIVEISIDAKCLKDENKECSYEGTAFAAYALAKKGYGTGIFLPYLVGYLDKYEKFLPEAFLYLLTGNADYANKLLEQQKTGYWIAPNSAYGKYYDTALALFALQDYRTEEADIATKKAKTWLLSEQTTKGDAAGSWKNSKRDTAFILFAAWPKEPTKLPEEIWCEDAGYSCVPQYECLDENRLDYYCMGNYVCCEEKLKKCWEIGGKICREEEICEGGELKIASDTKYCCIEGDCREKTECEKEGHVCRDECEKNEEEVEYECEAGKKCCREKEKIEESECEKEGHVCRDECEKNEKEVEYECEAGKVCCQKVEKVEKRGLWWIFLIIIILALIFFFFKKRRKKPPAPSIPPIPPRRILPPTAPAGPLARPTLPLRKPIPPPLRPAAKTKTEKELEETMKKLKEISEK